MAKMIDQTKFNKIWKIFRKIDTIRSLQGLRRITMSKKNIQFKTSLNQDEFWQLCRKVLSNVPKMEFIEHESGFKLKEKKGDAIDFVNSTTWTASAKLSFSNGLINIEASCFGLGPVQNKHVKEFAEIIKGLLERGINEDTLNQTVDNTTVRCPKCGGTQIQLKNRGFSLGTGFIGSGRSERVCMNCLYKF